MSNQLPGSGRFANRTVDCRAGFARVDGELAVTMLVARGDRAVPYLEHFLLAGSPRTIALVPRCRAVHALGAELGAYSTLISYFREYEFPRDAEVLFASKMPSAAPSQGNSSAGSLDEVFHVLLDAAKQRATGGPILRTRRISSIRKYPVALQSTRGR